INPTAAAVDLSGWIVKDSDDTHVAVLPAGSSVAAGGFFIVEEQALGYGLGSADAVRLFAPDGATLVDQHSWTSHAPLTLGRCPDATGPFAETTSSTKGAANVCDGSGGNDGGPGDDTVTLPWAGEQSVDTVDPAGLFGTNM
ncbi:lamin tail domain-containing protein, partial [Clavibacter michiganensis]|uniref:lamin tail domain-containing protein n=1 Tax=Clavibacter michiganensis TaxID=28447 RepID=UPI00292DAD6B